jgi:hypothetical protein
MKVKDFSKFSNIFSKKFDFENFLFEKTDFEKINFEKKIRNHFSKINFDWNFFEIFEIFEVLPNTINNTVLDFITLTLNY